jgi:hypothetical protein
VDRTQLCRRPECGLCDCQVNGCSQFICQLWDLPRLQRHWISVRN